MSIDLHQLFDEAGFDGPTHRLDCDYIVRRGRRARVRRRTSAGAALAVGAGMVVLAGTTVAGNVGGSASPGVTTAGGPSATALPTTSPTPSQAAGIEPALTAVTLPDPAPGFPYRRSPDGAPRLTTPEDGSEPYWARMFMLAAKPEITTTDSNGNVGGRPTGPEITMLVGNFPVPSPESIAGQRVSSHPQVAGVVGTALQGQEKGVQMATLYFKSGRFCVEIFGSGGVTTEQLVALGNSLTGLA